MKLNSKILENFNLKIKIQKKIGAFLVVQWLGYSSLPGQGEQV